ncbi:MAG: hypothetical protein JW832_09015 [Deltaproteobacteria bacterium]|nr:hypothetical protein [Deltaproteobacteria bacterium]
MISKNKEKPQMQLVAKAEKALKEAVAKTIEDHRLTGDPIVVWKDGKVVKVHPEKLQARETKAEYTVKKRKKQ